MGESELIRNFRSEAELSDFAGLCGAAWRRARRASLVVGLRGDLGSGKTSWVRSLLRGLGHGGRVPSPTYTLLEHYRFANDPPLEVLHLDLYRLASDTELENLGVRDWLAADHTWLFVEWIERAPALARRADLIVELSVTGPTSRRLAMRSQSDTGIEALEDCRQEGSSNDS